MADLGQNQAVRGMSDVLQASHMAFIRFDTITPDKKSNWLNQSHPDFDILTPLIHPQAKFANRSNGQLALFSFYSMGVSTNRDDWVYDFEVGNLRAKALFFADTYNALLNGGDHSYDPAIKWSSTLRSRFQRGLRITYNDGHRIESAYRPFITKNYFADVGMNDRLTRNHFEMFGPDLSTRNRVICFQSTGARRPFAALATEIIPDNHLFFDGTQCLPLYRYTADGERVSNITEWGLRQFREHYGDDGIGDEDVFAYVYAMLHDPAYRQRYEIDLRREFPRVFFQDDFAWWAGKGRELLELHIGFESVEPWGLERVEAERPSTRHGRTYGSSGRAGGSGSPSPQPSPVKGEGASPRVILRADKERGVIRLDGETTLAGVPPEAWEYRRGSRSALEWVLDQYKERKPRDPTIRERFNTYRFADHKERVIDLLGRVCAVSAFTSNIVDELGRRSSVEQTST